MKKKIIKFLEWIIPILCFIFRQEIYDKLIKWGGSDELWFILKIIFIIVAIVIFIRVIWTIAIFRLKPKLVSPFIYRYNGVIYEYYRSKDRMVKRCGLDENYLNEDCCPECGFNYSGVSVWDPEYNPPDNEEFDRFNVKSDKDIRLIILSKLNKMNET